MCQLEAHCNSAAVAAEPTATTTTAATAASVSRPTIVKNNNTTCCMPHVARTILAKAACNVEISREGTDVFECLFLYIYILY